MTEYLVNNVSICLRRSSLNYTDMNVYKYNEIHDI